MRVLMVDDERPFVEMLAERLSLRGITAQTACSAGEALAQLAAGPVDVAFFDVGLPGMDGLALLREVRERYPDLDVVMLTGSTELEGVLSALRHGARNWLPKPVAVDMLVEECGKAAARARERRRQARLAELDRARVLARIAEGVAHEVNNPVNIMMQCAGDIEDLMETPDLKDMPEREEILHAVRLICRQSLRVRDLTSRLLMVGHGLDPRTQPVDMIREVNTATASLRPRMEARNIRLLVDMPADLPHPLWSDLEAQQTLGHLLQNALDASPDGGELRIAARLLPAEEGGGPWFALTVADTGHGIAPEHMPYIFEPFFSTREVGQGCGLGLAVCRSLVQGRGGTIDARSDAGGSVFTLRLPVTADAPRIASDRRPHQRVSQPLL